ncbi:amino acid adenylation domain-containing protein, partial [Colwellia sp. Bg11-12]|uniref:non-ribosomal peptide synthetase n=1 Tax=Colwellia sp. Bg11-12 TaxID=2759817 RepID=UPI0015F62243
MNTPHIINKCAELGIKLSLDTEGLALGGNTKALTAELLALIKAHKQALIAHIQSFLPHSKSGSGIAKVSRASDLPLSPAQMQLWLVNEIQGQSPECNMPGACKIDGVFHFEHAQKALTDIIQRHEILRSCYRKNGESPVQVIQEEFDFAIDHHDLRLLPNIAQKNALNRLLENDINKPFNLENDIMLRASYIELGNAEQPHGVLLFNTHHIAFDGWSMDILHREFFTLYHANISGASNPIPPMSIQYADYASWQLEKTHSPAMQLQVKYWQDTLQDLPVVHSFPLDFIRPDIKSHQGAVVTQPICAKTAKGLGKLANQYKLTPFMLLHAAVAMVLSRHSGSKDIVIGTPVANRLEAELEPLIGFFVNTLLLRANTKHKTLAAYLAHIRELNINAQSNQGIAINQLVELLNPPRSSAYNPLFQIMLTIDNNFSAGGKALSMELAGSKLSIMAPDTVAVKSQFDLDVNIQLNDQGGTVKWVYDTALFFEDTIRQINSHLCQFLTALSQQADLNNADIALAQISMYDAKQTKTLVNKLNGDIAVFNQHSCIQTLFEKQAATSPDNIAVTSHEAQLTYGQLNRQANQLAHYLRSQYQIKPDTLVGVCLERSCDMLVAILAILKAGAAYVPLDPAYPHARLMDMVEDANLPLIISQNALSKAVTFKGYNTLFIDQVDYSTCPQTNINPSSFGLKGSHLAYVIFTSGSTGRPKGVMVEHKNLQHFILNTDSRYKLSAADKVLQLSTMNFDIFVEEMFATLCSGASLVLRNEDCMSGEKAFSEFCQQHEISVISLPTSFWLQLNADNRQVSFASLRMVILGGEALPIDAVNRYFDAVKDVEMINSYGPTEATVTATSYHIRHQIAAEVLPIGNANVNTSLLILDDELNPVPQGTVGELYIGGAGVARGYLNRPEQTAERFIDNPYRELFICQSHQRLYKTGDLVRHRADNNVEFIGRIDDQVKIRGFRIELGEIENTLSTLDCIKSCMVLALATDIGAKQLVAYAQTNSDTQDQQHFIGKIRAHLSAQLPDYMVPAAYAIVETWPLTPNGKIDKKALPEPEIVSLQGQYIAPQTVFEAELQTLWS